MSRTVAVLGGGVGGLAVARELRSRLPREDRVVLVERNPRQSYSSLFLRLIVGECEVRDVVRDISWVTRRGVELLEAEVLEIDPEKRTVETSRGEIAPDALVVALGAERTLDGVPGAQEKAAGFYSLEEARRLGEQLSTFSGGRVVIAVLGTPYSCPAAPYEAALLLEAYLRRKGLKFEIQVVTPEPYPMPTAGPTVGNALKEMLAQRGILFRPRTRTIQVSEKSLTVKPLDVQGEGEASPEDMPFDLLIAIPLHRPPEPVARSPLAREGFIPVDPFTLTTSFPGVWPWVMSPLFPCPAGTGRTRRSFSLKLGFLPTARQRW